jgi:hypothetical protein
MEKAANIDFNNIITVLMVTHPVLARTLEWLVTASFCCLSRIFCSIMPASPKVIALLGPDLAICKHGTHWW